MRRIICFIDDSDFEHDLVRNEIAPSSPELTFIQAHTFEEARDFLGQEIPVLFLLDLWGQDADVKQPEMTSRRDLEMQVAGFKSLEEVFEGLEDFPGDKANEYLKRLFTVVDGWRRLFEDVCNRIGQNRKYGLANLEQARQHYPGVPGVFYTRKSLISDAVAMFHAGADGLFIKPTARDDASTRILTRQYGPELIEQLSLIVDRQIDHLREHGTSYRNRYGLPEKGPEALIESWKKFRNI